MKIIQNLLSINQVDGNYPRIGLTIGNFDGVHIGHRELLKKIKNECVARNLFFVVLTFIPHPQKILRPEKSRFLISSYNQRRRLLKDMGVDYLVEVNFTRDFSTKSAAEFLSEYLFQYSGLHCLYLGHDFAFGANKKGGPNIVRELCENQNIQVEIQPKYDFNGETVSSSLIRQKMVIGDVAQVESLLKRPFQLEGFVIKGEGRGKKIGFPTANIQVSEDLIIPQVGVYVTRTLYNGMTFHSITNIGHNPTFIETNEIHIETHLFDFSSDIYGEVLEIEFIQKIRDEKKFKTVSHLVEQIREDVILARKILELK